MPRFWASTLGKFVDHRRLFPLDKGGSGDGLSHDCASVLHREPLPENEASAFDHNGRSR